MGRAVKIGSLFTGYGGLDQAVSAFTGATTAWVSDMDKGVNKILAHRYPDASNLGDIASVDWSKVEPVNILTGGFPCQDVSTAGKRAGIRPGTRSGLWSHMCYGIDQLKPELVVIENVRGLLSADAHSDMEPCPWCVGDGQPQFALRALGAVLGDLADIGYDAKWCGLRAADIGACHGRFRVFVVAYPRSETGNLWTRLRTPEPPRRGRRLPARDGREVIDLLPTPAVNDMGAGKTVDAWDAWDAWTDDMRSKHGNGNGHGKSLHIETERLFGTPTARAGKGSGLDHRQTDRAARGDLEAQTRLLLPTPIAAEGIKPSNSMGVERRETTGQVFLTNVVVSQFGDDPTETKTDTHGTWGDYGPAIAQWERVNGPAPAPTEPGKTGTPRLSAKFTEWMMGLPAGWVTDVPGITRNEALKACGNGVVPQQAFEALCRLL